MKTGLAPRIGNKGHGFTLIELVVVVVIAAIVFGIGISIYLGTRPAKVTGSWTIAPATIPSSGGSFTYSVKVKVGGQWQPHPGRALSFRVVPAAHLTVTPASGNTQPGGDLVVTVTPATDYCYGGNLWVTDVKSGIEDPPVHFTVSCP